MIDGMHGGMGIMLWLLMLLGLALGVALIIWIVRQVKKTNFHMMNSTKPTFILFEVNETLLDMSDVKN